MTVPSLSQDEHGNSRQTPSSSSGISKRIETILSGHHQEFDSKLAAILNDAFRRRDAVLFSGLTLFILAHLWLNTDGRLVGNLSLGLFLTSVCCFSYGKSLMRSVNFIIQVSGLAAILLLIREDVRTVDYSTWLLWAILELFFSSAWGSLKASLKRGSIAGVALCILSSYIGLPPEAQIYSVGFGILAAFFLSMNHQAAKGYFAISILEAQCLAERNSLDTGLLAARVVIEENGEVLRLSSRPNLATERLFGVVDGYLPDLKVYLFGKSTLNEHEIGLVLQILIDLSHSGYQAFVRSREKLPGYIVLKNANAHKRSIVRLSWSALESRVHGNQIDSFIVAIESETRGESQDQWDGKAGEDIWRQRIKRELFSEGPQRSLDSLSNIRPVIAEIMAVDLLAVDLGSLKKLFGSVHGAKTSSVYGLKIVVDALLRLEAWFLSTLPDFKDVLDVEAAEELKRTISEIDRLLNLYEQVIKEDMNWRRTDEPVEGFNGLDFHEIFENRKDKLQDFLSGKKYFKNKFLNSTLERAYPRLADLAQERIHWLENIARELGKDLPTFEYRGIGIKVAPFYVEVLKKVFSILATNSLDHGLEKPAERGLKPAVGSICLEAEVIYECLLMRWSDDGRGLDLGLIALKAQQRGVTNGPLKSRDQDIAQLIFEYHLSTANSVGKFSGLGLGLAEVKSSIEGCGGKVQILLVEDSEGLSKLRPFKIEISLPHASVAWDGVD